MRAVQLDRRRWQYGSCVAAVAAGVVEWMS